MSDALHARLLRQDGPVAHRPAAQTSTGVDPQRRAATLERVKGMRVDLADGEASRLAAQAFSARQKAARAKVEGRSRLAAQHANAARQLATDAAAYRDYVKSKSKSKRKKAKGKGGNVSSASLAQGTRSLADLTLHRRTP